MIQSFVPPNSAISAIQSQIKMLERCLKDSNKQDEVSSELIALVKNKHLSLDELRQYLKEFNEKLDKVSSLIEKFKEKSQTGEIAVLYFVKYNLLFQEILESYFDFYYIENSKELIIPLTESSVSLYKIVQHESNPGITGKDDNYVIVETLKYIIQALIKAGLQFNVFSETDIHAWGLGNIVPQESETMLIFLASKTRWESVYKNLAVS